MTTDLLLDALLNKASQQPGNHDLNELAGWNNIAIDPAELPADVALAAQLYHGPHGRYKLVYRGSAGPFNPGDAALNRAILCGTWSAEMARSISFTYFAIKQVQRLERGYSFRLAKSKLSVTGHGQGAFKAELNAVLFGLDGSGLDGVGANTLARSIGWQEMRTWVRSLEAGFNPDTVVGNFLARRYTALPCSSPHATGVRVDRTAASLAFGQELTLSAADAGDDIAPQATVLHSIDSIIGIEQMRRAVPWLQKIGEAADYKSIKPLVAEIAARWAAIGSTDLITGMRGDALEAMVMAFLYGRRGQYVSVQQNECHARLMASNGDELLLSTDGSGQIIAGRGGEMIQTEYAKGSVRAVTNVQHDGAGMTHVNRRAQSAFSTCTIDPVGQILRAECRRYDIDNLLLSETLFIRREDGTASTQVINRSGVVQRSVETTYFRDGGRMETASTTNGVVTSYFDCNGELTDQSQPGGRLLQVPPLAADHDCAAPAATPPASDNER